MDPKNKAGVLLVGSGGLNEGLKSFSLEDNEEAVGPEQQPTQETDTQPEKAEVGEPDPQPAPTKAADSFKPEVVKPVQQAVQKATEPAPPPQQIDPALARYVIPRTDFERVPERKEEAPPIDDWYEREERPKERLRDRLRGNPALYVIGVGLSLCVAMVVWGLVGFGADEKKAAKVPATMQRDLYPSLERPKVRDKQYSVEEVRRMMDEAARKEQRRKDDLLQAAQAAELAKAREAQAAAQPAVELAPPPPATTPKQRPAKRKSAPVAHPAPVAKAEPAPAPPKPRIPMVYIPGGEIPLPEETEELLEIPAGISFRARLQVGVSTAFSGTAVLAQVLESVVGAEGKIVLPSGTMLQGTFRGSTDRVMLDFHQAIVANKKLKLKAFAVDRGLPGVVAKAKKTGGRREDDAGDRATHVAARGALRTAGGVVSALSGSGVGGQLVSNLGQEGVNELGRDVQGGVGYSMEQTILEIPAGTVVELITAG